MHDCTGSCFFWCCSMRYYYVKPDVYANKCAVTYKCDHPVYNRCTLYTIGSRGLAVIQQRFNQVAKATYWTNIDPWLVDDIYVNPRFKGFFSEHAAEADNDIYPTVTVRQLMWALKMKPLPKQRWETVFDHKDI